MAGHDDQEPSFDPRSWGKPPTIPADKNNADQVSFDPRSWFANEPAPPAAGQAAPVTRRTVEPLHPGSWPITTGCGVAIAIAGALTAWSARAPAPPVRTQAPVAASTATPPRGLSSRTMNVSGIAYLAPNLLAAGVAPADADTITKRAMAALGNETSELRISFDYVEEPLEADKSGARVAIHPRRLLISRLDGTGVELTLREDGSFAAERRAAHLTRALHVVRGKLDAESFYSSAVAAGVSDVLVSDFANAFQFDFDFQREIAPGDIIEAAYEQSANENGEAVGAPVLVFASLSTAAKSRALYRFQPPGENKPEWFDGEGRGTRRSLMRTPIEATRISSRFGIRNHPVLGYVKMHRGVDFAAPIGTPIYAAGDATVIFAGLKGPNGNFIKLHHDNGWETLYLHMNRIWPGMAAGVRVTQGQQIGEVGLTGRTTGPHLHYEVHIDGQPVDPLSIDTGTGRTLSGTAMAAFRKLRERIDARRAAAK